MRGAEAYKYAWGARDRLLYRRSFVVRVTRGGSGARPPFGEAP